MSKNNARNRQQARQQKKRQQQYFWIGAGVVSVVAVIGVLLLTAADSRTSVSFPDIHGMSFSGDGEELWVATHTGLVAYENGDWSKPGLPVNDYMGYSGTENGFFSSGHPGAGSRLPNPIGLVSSDDHGATVNTINFLGESDFHVMGVSYYDDNVYVINPASNALLSVGLHHSLDGGELWQESEAGGLTAAPIQLAVHPSEAGVVAAATQRGLFLSNDFGDSFTQVDDGGIVSSVAFDPGGERLLFGFDTLFSYALSDGQITPLPTTPEIDENQAILYIAVNPASDELAFATSDRNIFFASNGGQSWQQIGENGVSR